MPAPSLVYDAAPAFGAAPAVQVAPVPASPLALVGTFLAGWAFFAFTAQIAASYVLESAPWRRAVVVGLVPAVAAMTLVRFDPLVIVPVSVLADAAAIHLVYDVRYRTTAVMVAVHYTTSVVIVIFLTYLLALLSTAPG